MTTDENINEIIENQAMLERSLSHAKKRLVINGNASSRNKSLNKQIQVISIKLRTLRQWQFTHTPTNQLGY
jgi:hypothetical protein